MERTSGLLLLLPQEALPLVIVVGALLVMLGVASVRAVLGAVVAFAMLPVLSPIVEAMVATLPAWMALLFFAAVSFWCFQAVATTVIGRGAVDHMVGSLAADLVRLGVRAVFLPLRLVWWMISR